MSYRTIFDTTVRDARWLNAERVIILAWGLLAAIAIAAAVEAAFGIDFADDFRSYWAASLLAMQGRPAAAYGSAAFLYPPVYLFVCWPLALLPFTASAVAWLAATGALFVASIRRLVPRSGWIVAAAFPAAWFNAAGGQNGFLTAGLLTFGICWMDARPALAGIFFGCLAYKPQFAMVLPFALLASERWRVLISAAVTVLVLILATFVVFGWAPWAGFIQSLPFGRLALDAKEGEYEKLASVAGAALMAGASMAAALTLQAIVAIAACVLLVVLGRRCRDALPLGAAICVAAALTSPWVHYYDLTILALPIAWLVSEGTRTGTRAWEKLSLLLAYLLPLIGMPLASAARMPITPIVLAAMLALIGRRCVADSPATRNR